MEDLLFDFWKFACERQNIFYKKLKNTKQPYTKDVILQKYKFCNTYRVLDRVSQFLLSNVIHTKKQYSIEDTTFRIILFKIFNLPNTWVKLENKFGDITLKNFDKEKYSKFLHSLKNNPSIYNSAYISCATKAFGFDSKHDNHLHLLYKMFIEDKIYEKLEECKTFKEAFEIIKQYPLLGNFMSYQLTTDLNYSNYFNWDDNSFTIVGPGSKRGINKVFGKVKNYEDIIFKTHKNQENDLKRFKLKFKYLKNHKLQTIDIQNLFCEFDKYCRVAKPELKSNRTKIKSKYEQKKESIIFVLPPKWKAKIV